MSNSDDSALNRRELFDATSSLLGHSIKVKDLPEVSEFFRNRSGKIVRVTSGIEHMVVYTARVSVYTLLYTTCLHANQFSLE